MGIFRLVHSFLEDRYIKVRLKEEYTKKIQIQYRILQGSLFALILYLLYLTKILNKDYGLKYKYMNDLIFYRIDNIKSNAISLTQDFHCIFAYNTKEKIVFILEKQKVIYFSCKCFMINTNIVISFEITIYPIVFSNNGE